MTLPLPNPGSTDPNYFDLSAVPDEIKPEKYLSGGRPRMRDLAKNKRHGWYSDAKKMQAACAFAVTGNSRRVSELVKVPEGTIRAWKTTEWWNELQSRIRVEQNEEFDTKITKLLDKAVEQINDRLQDGDYVYNARADKLIRKPVGARDLSHITAQMVDKRQLLRGEPTSRTAKASENDKLVRLAEEFKRFATAKEVVSIAETIEEELGEEHAVEEGQIQEDNLPEYSDGDETWEATEAGDSNSDVAGWDDEEIEEEVEEQNTLTINEMFSE